MHDQKNRAVCEHYAPILVLLHCYMLRERARNRGAKRENYYVHFPDGITLYAGGNLQSVVGSNHTQVSGISLTEPLIGTYTLHVSYGYSYTTSPSTADQRNCAVARAAIVCHGG